MSQSHTTIGEPSGNRFDRSKRAKRALVRAICASARGRRLLGGRGRCLHPGANSQAAVERRQRGNFPFGSRVRHGGGVDLAELTYCLVVLCLG